MSANFQIPHKELKKMTILKCTFSVQYIYSICIFFFSFFNMVLYFDYVLQWQPSWVYDRH